MKRNIYLWGGISLLVVWAVALGGIGLARAQRMTAEKTIAYLEANPLVDLPPPDRARAIEGMAERVNRLTFEERQKFRFEGRLREWFEELTPAERMHYIDLTLPKGMKQLMDAFNEMPSARRKQIVTRALADMNRMREELGQRDSGGAFSDSNMQRMVDEGMRSFIRDANAETKLDLQPLIEQMQSIMQMAR